MADSTLLTVRRARTFFHDLVAKQPSPETYASAFSGVAATVPPRVSTLATVCLDLLLQTIWRHHLYAGRKLDPVSTLANDGSPNRTTAVPLWTY